MVQPESFYRRYPFLHGCWGPEPEFIKINELYSVLNECREGWFVIKGI